MIKVYSTNACPKCKIITSALDTAGLEYIEVFNTDFLVAKGFDSVPQIQGEDGVFRNFIEAKEYYGL